MADHKFKPKDWVLVRDYEEAPWWLAVYSHYSAESIHKHKMADGQSGFHQCIPYTPETAHLLGTSQPYEPPKPPVEYEWGQKVEVLATGTSWERGIWLKRAPNPECPQQHLVAHEYGLSFWYKENEIRPLPDTAAHRGGFLFLSHAPTVGRAYRQRGRNYTYSNG